MITLPDLIRFGMLYPSGSLDSPVYAFAGGTASQCWLYDSEGDRKHHDIDVFTFSTGSPSLFPDGSPSHSCFFIGGFSQDGITAYTQGAPISLQISRGSYFDSEIAPTKSDVRLIEIQGISLLVLSPEFVAISKVSYPNVHRSYDFLDVLVLNQNGWLRDPRYLSDLLTRTSAGKLIDGQDLLNLKTQDDVQVLVDYIQRQLIRRFLNWDRVNVDVLTPSQFFVLLDVDSELFHLSTEMLQFIDTVLMETTLSGRRLQIAKLGLHFLVAGIPHRGQHVLQNPNFRTLIHRGLALILKQPSFWLILSKICFTTLRQLAFFEELIGRELDLIWNPAMLVRIMNRILFEDPSRFILLSSVKTIYHDLKVGHVSATDCAGILPALLASNHELTAKENLC